MASRHLPSSNHRRRIRFDLANLPTDTATLHQIIAAQAAEGEAREAEQPPRPV
jgi:hypothetical protein